MKLPPPPLEREIMRQFAAVFRVYRLNMRRQNVGVLTGASGKPVRFGTPGMLDWNGFLPAVKTYDGTRYIVHPRYIECEAKRPGKRPTALQYQRMHELNSMGHVGMWSDCPIYLSKALQILIAGGTVRINQDGDPEFTEAEADRERFRSDERKNETSR